MLLRLRLPVNMPLVLTGLVLSSSLCLGGGTRGGFLSDCLLQVISLVALISLLWRTPLLETPRTSAPLLCALLIVPICALALVPLPPVIWQAISFRDQLQAANAIALDEGRAWMALSTAPHQGWLAIASLLPPLAIFIGALHLDHLDRRKLSALLILLGLAGALVGLLQVAQGADSSLRFFSITNPTEAVGFFANRNHFAALLYCITLIAAVWSVEYATRISALPHHRRLSTRSFLLLIINLTLTIVFVATQTLARSRAGLGLTIVALVGALVVALPDRHRFPGFLRGSLLSPLRLFAAAIAIALLFALQFSLYRILERFEADPLGDARVQFARNTYAAFMASLPFGTGTGTFVPIYSLFEPPADILANTFANHAHNDILEFGLETGLFGIFLAGSLALWFTRQASAAWKSHGADFDGALLDAALPRAASLIIVLLLAHSLVDYPLRTSAMLGVFAFASALLVAPLQLHNSTSPASSAIPSKTNSISNKKRRKPLSRIKADTDLAVGSPTSTPKPVHHGELWGKHIEWPEAWRPKKAKPVR